MVPGDRRAVTELRTSGLWKAQIVGDGRNIEAQEKQQTKVSKHLDLDRPLSLDLSLSLWEPNHQWQDLEAYISRPALLLLP